MLSSSSPLLSTLPQRAYDVTVRTSKSQVAFRRHRGFAYLWRPGQYLRRPGAEVALSSRCPATGVPRFKQVEHPAPSVWMHHLEIHTLQDLDEEVAGWLQEAADHVGRHPGRT